MLLRTLGGLSLEGSTLKRPKPLLLLSYLALEGAKDRKHLSELFWPRAASPMHSLRVALTQLRQRAPGVLEGDEQLSATVACDAKELLETLENGELEKAREAYKGPFLKGFYLEELSVELEEWIYATREFIAARVREGLLKLAEKKAAAGRASEAAKLAEEAYWLSGAPEPDPEHFSRVYRLLVAGGSSRVREVKEEAESFGLTLARASLEVEKQPAVPRGKLPPRSTSFVGRDLELVEIANLLSQEDCRLITLLGPGGVGKTRLALKMAQDVLGQASFGDGVGFVDLSALSDPALIPSAIAGALGVVLPGDQLLTGLVHVLEDKHLLLVLDNFEHLVAAAGTVSELLKHCLQLKVLVTSRERLKLSDEWVVLVEGFPVPDTLEKAEHLDAVKLFVQRAKRVRLDFSLEENLPHVLRICKLVDGSPLGIELAAAWVRLMTAKDIAAEIEQNLDLLESSERDAGERHESIRATFEYSWKLLSAKEQDVLAKLSVFVGGFTRAAAAKVAGASIPVLASLSDKSLLRLLPNSRYDRHPLLYSYTQEKLAEHNEQLETQAAHARCFLELAEAAEPKLAGPEQALWLERLETEHDNLRAALSWALEHDPETGLRLGGALWRFWYIHGHLSEGRRWLEAALGRASSPLAARAKVLHGAGVLAYFQNDNEAATAFLEEASVLWREGEDEGGLGFTLHYLGWLAHARDDEVQAVRLFEEGLALSRKVKDTSGIAQMLYALGVLALGESDYAHARALCEESLALFRELGDKGSMAAVLMSLGGAAWDQGDFAQAEALVTEGLALYRQLGYKHGMSWGLNTLASFVQRRSEVERAAALFAESLVLAWELGSKAGMAFSLSGLAGIFGAQGELERAARLYGLAEEVLPVSNRDMSASQRTDHEHAVACLRTQMGKASFAQAWAEGRAMPLDKAIGYAIEAHAAAWKLSLQRDR
jgi:predicted ATPase